MIKKAIRFFSIFIIVLISSLLLFDGFIIKHFIIKKSEELTGKKTIIDKVNLYYFPNIKIEVLGLKIPNPDRENYIITSKQLMIEISLADLLKKKLIINNIISDNSNFFNDSEQPISLKKKNKFKENKSKSTSVDFLTHLI